MCYKREKYNIKNEGKGGRKMPVIDLTQPFISLLCIACIICAIFLGHELKRAIVPAIALILCIAMLVVHASQLFIFGEQYAEYSNILSVSMIFDFGFILITYLSYLWIDDIEAKHRNKKSIDNSLDWFWSKVV